MAEEKLLQTARVEIHYLKSAAYREVPCDGVIGGITPQRRVWFGVYNERGPVPRLVTYDLKGDPGGTVTFDEAATKPSSIDSKSGIIRTLEVGVALDLQATIRLHKWLGDRIKQLSGTDAAV